MSHTEALAVTTAYMKAHPARHGFQYTYNDDLQYRTIFIIDERKDEVIMTLAYRPDHLPASRYETTIDQVINNINHNLLPFEKEIQI